MNKEKLLTLIHSPYITEKATSVGSLNQVVFKVDLSASKSEIKKAVENLFDAQKTLIAPQPRIAGSTLFSIATLIAAVCSL